MTNIKFKTVKYVLKYALNILVAIIGISWVIRSILWNFSLSNVELTTVAGLVYMYFSIELLHDDTSDMEKYLAENRENA
jgi:small neutral amino acid transporter SnatA (MarC family)